MVMLIRGILYGLALIILVIVFFPRKLTRVLSDDDLGTGRPLLRATNASTPISQVQWVGTHNSASYQMMADVSLPGKLNGAISVDTLATLQKWIGFAQRQLGAWVLTQEYNVYDQLVMGVRALDLRVAYSERDKQYVYAHTLANARVEDVLENVKRFLRNYPSEFIIISSKPDWENRETMASPERGSEYLRIVNERFGSDVFLPYVPNESGALDKTTIGDAVKKGYRVLFSYSGPYEHVVEKERKWIWPSSIFTQSWITGSNKSEVFAHYEAIVNSRVPQEQLKQVSLFTTPDGESIRRAYVGRLNPFSELWSQGSGSVISDGIYTQQKWMCDLAQKNTQEATKSVNIWWMDAPQPEFVKLFNPLQLDQLQKFC
jgi:hypothetical protein